MISSHPWLAACVVITLLLAGCSSPTATMSEAGVGAAATLGAEELSMGKLSLVEHNETSALWRWEGALDAHLGPPAPAPPVHSTPFHVPPVPLRIEATLTARSLPTDAGVSNPPSIVMRILDADGEARCLARAGCVLYVHPARLATWRMDVQCDPTSTSCDPPSNPYRVDLRLAIDAPREWPEDDGIAVFGGLSRAVEPTGLPRVFRTGHLGPEPNMGVNSQGSIFASAISSILRSRDGGAAWETVHMASVPNADPMMWVDPWTDCVYNVPMFPLLVGATIYASCDDGETWSAIHSQHIGRSDVYDHQKFATALPGPHAPAAAGLLHPTVFVICYNTGLLRPAARTHCATSYDGGRTWPHDAPAWSRPVDPACEIGQNGHPTGAPDGTIVFAKAWLCEHPLVVVSRDSGLTWTVRKGPTGLGADTVDPEVAFTDDGAMYLLWQSRRGEDHAYLARSDDLGETWAGPWNVTPPGVGSSIFASLHAGSPGRVAMAFHATNNTVDPSQAPDDARWYTYIVTTEDGNTESPTFVSYRVQPLNDPVQVGSICNGAQGCHDGNRNLLDFIDGAMGPDGTFYTVIADGCPEGCGAHAARPEFSRSRELVLIRLDGWRLRG